MNPTRAAACGKVILLGEHAVVYGVPAIAVGIERGAWAEATPVASGTGPCTLHVRGWNLHVSDDDSAQDQPLGRALRGLVQATRAERDDLGARAIVAEADLPPGGGLGCSAALGVAVARALDPLAPADVIAARVNAWERVFHGNPSGIDAAVASMGGCVLFRRGEGGVNGAAASIERVRLPSVFHLCVGHTGAASSTKSMVEGVARLRERRPEVAQKAFEAIGVLVKNARLAIEAGDRKAVGQLLDLNQMLLSGLFVSTPEIEQLCASARSAGALGAKLTGAGGGGCVVALVAGPAEGEAVLDAWKKDGFDGFLTTVGDAPARSREERVTPEAAQEQRA